MSQAGDKVLLNQCLKDLRLPVMRRDWEECARQSLEGQQGYAGFLLALATRELQQRRANQLQRRLKQARFPVMKTLEKTDLKLWPGVDALRLRELAECEWISRRENLLLIGRHGTGKSHAATVLGVEACRRTHRVLFTTAAELTNKLIEARAEHELQRYMKRLARFPLLVLDEVGCAPRGAV